MFKAGDIVECVDDMARYINKGQKYTLVCVDPMGVAVEVGGIVRWYRSSRFKKVTRKILFKEKCNA